VFGMNGLQQLLTGSAPAKVKRHAPRGSVSGLRSYGSELHVAGENGRGEQIPRSGQPHFGAIGSLVGYRVGRRASMNLALHVTLGKNAVDGVVLAKKEGRVIGPRFLLLPGHVHCDENDLMRLLGDYPMIRIQMDRLRPVDG